VKRQALDCGRDADAATTQAVEISHLRKTYGPVVAIDDVSFSVTDGEIFGILRPNGAGKTTTVECAVGLRSPDSGTIRLMGIDPQADEAKLHEITGFQLQSGTFQRSSGSARSSTCTDPSIAIRRRGGTGRGTCEVRRSGPRWSMRPAASDVNASLTSGACKRYLDSCG
jgi:ABC-type branched-subunit amino acid transport system ATPase component